MRFRLYSLLGASAFIPIVHGVYLNGWEVQARRGSIQYFMGLGLLNFTGAATYAARIPERWFPRTFDIYGASHQLMHVLVIGGALCYTTGLLRAFDYWRGLRLVDGVSCPIG